MAKANFPFTTFAGGEIGKEVLSRVNLEGYSACAETMENWLPDPSGGMILRPGLKFCVRPTSGDDFAWLLPFVYSPSQKYLMLLTNNALRVVQDGGIVTRSAVTAAITNGTFPSLTGWTDISTGSATAAAVSNTLELTSDGSATAGVRQAVTITETGDVHVLEVTVDRGPVTLQIGSTSGADDLFPRTTLRTGYHSLAFTPSGGTAYVQITSTAKPVRIVSSVEIAAAGDMVLTTPWATATLPKLMIAQSGDVLYVSSGVGHRKRIERYSSSSWSIVDTSESDGPFLTPNLDESLQVTPSVLSGNGTLTASSSLFRSTHVGSLWQITHSGQRVEASIAAENTFSDHIKVQGAGAVARSWNLITNYGSIGTTVIKIQRSVGNTTSWTDYQTVNNNNMTINDGLDNQTIYYRVGVKTGDYNTGPVTIAITYSGGTTTGIVRVTGYTSATEVDVEVLSPFAATTASNEWAEGAWSDAQSWPVGPALFDGRLWDGFQDRFAGSVSDGYESYQEGSIASDAVIRSVATGKVNPIVAMLPLARCLALTEGAEAELRSSSFDEPITSTSIGVRNIGTNGAAAVRPEVIDTRGIWIAANKTKAMESVYDVQNQGYSSRSLMRMHKKIGRPGLTQIAVSRHPDTRLWFVRSDGQLLCKLYEPAENVSAWCRIVTDGVIESVAVLPATDEDEIYVMVARQVGGGTKRYLEKLGSVYLEDATDAQQLDSYVAFDGSPTTTISGLGHLAGRTVRVFADGARLADAVVSGGGTVTLSREKSKGCVGLYYFGPYKSAKLAFGAQAGTALGMKARALHVMIDFNESMPMLKYGSNFTDMLEINDRQIERQYDSGPGLVSGISEQLACPGGLTRDPRVCLLAEAPFWVQIRSMIVGNVLNERV